MCNASIFTGITIYFFGFYNLQDSFASYNLQDATRTSMYLASDNSARNERGSFVINKAKFRDYLDKTRIKNLHSHKLNNGDYHVYYLADGTNPKVARNNTNDMKQSEVFE